MHTEVFNNIDTLIDMANSSLSIDEITAELTSLKKQIKRKENDIEDLKAIMTESRYFNASNELVDKNIEISLKNKITRLNRKQKDLKKEIDEVKNQERTLHNEITSLQDKFANDELYIASIKTKTENSNANEYYKTLLSQVKNNNELLKSELDKKVIQYNEVLKELETKNTNLSDISAKLDKEKQHLNDILDNLANPTCYIDEDLKAIDEEKLANLTKDLENLEKRKAELLTDANMVGADAKELIVNSDYYEAMNKIKELVKIVKKKPYMDINSNAILTEELEKKENLRVELSTLIDNKNYEELDTDTLFKRKEYIKAEIENHQKEIASYQQEINNIDSFVNETLGTRISEIENEILKTEKNINEYRNIIKDKSKSSRSKLNLESTITKKEKEKEILNEILLSYKNDLLTKIEQTNTLTNIIDNLNKDIQKKQEEGQNLQKLSLLDFKTKDYAEEEQDKEKLKAINEEIKEIKNRQRFDKTPDEIFDQIDMLLADFKPNITSNEENKAESNKPMSLEIDNLTSSISSKENTNSEFKNLEYTGVIPDLSTNDNKEAEQQKSIETKNSTPSLEIDSLNIENNSNNNEKIATINTNTQTISESNRLKVIEMIPVETVKNPANNAGGN